MNIIEESENYALVKAEYRGDFINRKDVLSLMEDLRAKGFKPLHFEVGSRAFVCEKPAKSQTPSG